MKIKSFLNDLQRELFVSVLIILVGIASFFIGRFSVLETKIKQQEGQGRIKILMEDLSGKTQELKASLPIETKKESVSKQESQMSSDEQVVASKSGSKYHFPWCSGAKRISEKNKIVFKTIADARAAGYEPAANCKGLK